MANQWLRLWHDMPTDPKWRTIARVSGQPIATVQAIYLHLLVDASQNVTRGHATVTQEDLASALDVTEEVIQAVLTAMQGRVLDGMSIAGWDKRQVKKEDSGSTETLAKSAAERKRDERERKQKALLNATPVTPCHDESRKVTLDKEKDKEEIREEEIKKINPWPGLKSLDGIDFSHWPSLPTKETMQQWLAVRKSKKATNSQIAMDDVCSQLLAAAIGDGMNAEDCIRASVAKSWAGFNYQWIKNQDQGTRQTGKSTTRHNDFDNRDYTAGVTADGTF